MAEDLIINQTLSKKEKYEQLVPQIKALLTGETDEIANMANVAAALKTCFNFFWVGFYIVKQNELVLGPFQGPVACTRIQLGKGVCGTSWKQKETLIVPNVDDFPGHIACSAFSKSEIVLPLFNQNKEVLGVLDVDSEELNTFDAIDEQYLTQIIALLA